MFLPQASGRLLGKLSRGKPSQSKPPLAAAPMPAETPASTSSDGGSCYAVLANQKRASAGPLRFFR